MNLERLRMAVDDLLVKLARTFAKTKSQTVFLINNYDMTIAILKVPISYCLSIHPVLISYHKQSLYSFMFLVKVLVAIAAGSRCWRIENARAL